MVDSVIKQQIEFIWRGTQQVDNIIITQQIKSYFFMVVFVCKCKIGQLISTSKQVYGNFPTGLS